MAEILTVYNCGTAFNRQRTDELVANLSSRTKGAQNAEWIINDGPGSAPSTPGDNALPADHGRAASAKTPGYSRNDVNPRFVTQAKGIISGFGWEQNVEHSMRVIAALIEGSNSPPRVVNMVGWSRGSITCHMLAHAIHEDPRMAAIEVNIFAVDPVAGPGSAGDSEKATIPPNVNEYVAIAMEDESSFIMKPSLPVQHGAGGSRHQVYAMPGNHSSAVMLHSGPVAEITHNLALDFLARHGTELTSHFRLAPEKVCELYAIVRLTLEKYRAMGNRFASVRNVVMHKRDAQIPNVEQTKSFLNRHHQTVFRAAYPNINTFVAMGGKGTVPAQDFARVKSRWEATNRWLHDVVGVPVS